MKRFKSIILILAIVFVSTFSISIKSEASSVWNGRMVYDLGDSVVAGYGYYKSGGTQVSMGRQASIKGANLGGDRAISGAWLTNVSPSKCSYSSIYGQQLEWLKSDVAKNGYNKNTVVFVDGGSNDALFYCAEQSMGVKYWGISTNGTQSDMDIQWCTNLLMLQLVNLFGNTKDNANNVKIFWIMPSTEDAMGGSMNTKSNVRRWTYEAQREVLKAYAPYGVYIIDEQQLLRDWKYYSDALHPNASGYQVLFNKIESYL